jgi:signal transduction histidine kinase
VPEDQDSYNDPGPMRALLAECRQRLSEHLRITVSSTDSAIQHLLAIGLQLAAIEGSTDDPELRSQIEKAIQEADAAIKDLRRMVFDLQDGTDGDS